MAIYELVMPKMGESIFEATILNWLVEEGQEVVQDDIVLEVATDKVDSEIPSPVSGRVVELRANVDEVIKVGEIIAIIEVENNSGETVHKLFDEAESVSPKVEETSMVENAVIHPVSDEDHSATLAIKESDNRFYSPLVRMIAEKENISAGELAGIHGSGLAGRITKEDVMTFLDHRKEGKDSSTESISETSKDSLINGFKENASKVSHNSDLEEVIEMTRVRSAIADHMMHSKVVAAHVTSVIETDMTKIVNWRNRNKDKFFKQFGVKLTFTPIFVKIIAELLHEFPYLNATIDGKKVILKKYINVGIATALSDNTLIVPVVKNADRYNLVGLAGQCSDLVNRARKNSLSADEIRQGTFTLSNIGTFGNLFGTPLINQPEVAILATGAIVKKPAVIETEEGDFIGIRHKMFMSLSFDHRLIDGYLGGSFLKAISDKLEDFDDDDF
ncbi:dihydrolipoamide acetyltransferase family protein [Membranihabitans marinus]|uniref:dihydrolipoamide acetyltransferase family protein n=1 Tax=Membranihabitans marinus TaxID=1227546 RepID=UPI001F1FD1E8|nr:dihydrolipoamide acetyltransferase family protein [Membranihabitans marinus]